MKNEERVSSRGESERLPGIARLVGQVEKIVCESGEPRGIDAARASPPPADRLQQRQRQLKLPAFSGSPLPL